MILSATFVNDTASREEAAKYLGVSVSTLARWASKKEGPPYYIVGSKARYRPSDLDEFVETKRRETGAAC